MVVSSVIRFGIGLSGSMNSENLSVMTPFLILTAPISIILSFFMENPVVSISNTTNSPSRLCPLGCLTAFLSSFTRLPVTPYMSLRSEPFGSEWAAVGKTCTELLSVMHKAFQPHLTARFMYSLISPMPSISLILVCRSSSTLFSPSCSSMRLFFGSTAFLMLLILPMVSSGVYWLGGSTEPEREMYIPSFRLFSTSFFVFSSQNSLQDMESVSSVMLNLKINFSFLVFIISKPKILPFIITSPTPSSKDAIFIASPLKSYP